MNLAQWLSVHHLDALAPRLIEAGIDCAPSERVSLSLTAFDNRVRNAIANVTIDATTRQRRTGCASSRSIVPALSSPSVVPVPCASTASMSSGASPLTASARRITRC